MKIPFNQDQLNLLKIIGFDFDIAANLTSKQIVEIIEKVSEYLQLYGMGNNGLKPVGIDCENLLDFLADY